MKEKKRITTKFERQKMKNLDWKVKLKTNPKLTKKLRKKIIKKTFEDWYLNIPTKRTTLKF
jgi:hypothetical protein